ncbi:N-acetylmuramoyl-L-alanine amidase [bacterium]|nr:N-acetylmuramoyl-L-alanine amidase [bacterium]
MNLKLCFFIGLLVQTVAGQSELKLNYRDNSKSVVSVYSGDQDFVSLKDLADLTNAGIFDNPVKKKSVLYVPQHEIKVTAYNAFVVIDEKLIVQMPVTSLYIDGRIFVPVQFFIPVLNSILSAPVTVNGQTLASANLNEVKAATKDSDETTESKIPSKINLTRIDFEKKSNGLLIKLKTEKDFSASELEIWKNKTWVYITVSGGVYDNSLSESILKAEAYKLIKKSLIFQHKHSAQLSFQLTADIPGQEITYDEKNHLILVSFRVNDPKLLDGPSTQSGVNLTQKQSQWKIDKIVLDAGHGGKDIGASGKGGTKEKDITLAITLKVGKLVQEQLGIKVDYTRSTDKYITLKGRTQYANAQNAKVFVSIHCNSSTNRKGNGFETFFLSPSRNDEALAVARKENEVIHMEEEVHDYGDFTDEKFILAHIMQSVFVKESEELAGLVLKGIDTKMDIKNRGVAQAPFYVLMGASMPSILVETAFISNPTEEKLLKSDDFQNKMAQGIVDGIKKFVEYYEKGS